MKSSFSLSLECRVTNTGPFTATMTAMSVDMVGPQGKFGRLELPEMTFTENGGHVRVENQRIHILDMNPFIAFTKALMQQEKTLLTIENGKPKMKVVGMKVDIDFRKTIEIAGLNGPRTEFVGADEDVVTMKMYNPSPLELDFGLCSFDFKDPDQVRTVLATITGDLFITRGESAYDFKVTAKTKPGGAIAAMAMIGAEARADSWVRQIMQHFHVSLPLTRELGNFLGTGVSGIPATVQRQGDVVCSNHIRCPNCGR